MQHSHTPLGSLSKEQFLNEYWQQKPLLIRQAFPDIQCPIEPDELAGLACEDEASARIVIERHAQSSVTLNTADKTQNNQGKTITEETTSRQEETPWEVRYAPLSEEDFTDLPESHWTLLVNDIETWIPEFQDIQQAFDFIPSWRLDDLMLSYAADQGSVGPHTDEYDVFLLQIEGTRHWNINQHFDRHGLIPDIDLAILAEFEAEQDWYLEPGDMLYLPPNWAHHGVAVGDCFTLSVGFRAPSQRDLLESYFGHLEQHKPLTQRFSDPQRSLQKHSSELRTQDIKQFRQLLTDALHTDDALLEQWLGNYLSESKVPSSEAFDTFDDHSGECLDHETEEHPKKHLLDSLIAANWIRPIEHRMIWLQNDKDVTLFANGDSYTLSTELKPLVILLSEHWEYSETMITDCYSTLVCKTASATQSSIEACPKPLEQEFFGLLHTLINKRVIQTSA